MYGFFFPISINNVFLVVCEHETKATVNLLKKNYHPCPPPPENHVLAASEGFFPFGTTEILSPRPVRAVCRTLTHGAASGGEPTSDGPGGVRGAVGMMGGKRAVLQHPTRARQVAVTTRAFSPREGRVGRSPRHAHSAISTRRPPRFAEKVPPDMAGGVSSKGGIGECRRLETTHTHANPSDATNAAVAETTDRTRSSAHRLTS